MGRRRMRNAKCNFQALFFFFEITVKFKRTNLYIILLRIIFTSILKINKYLRIYVAFVEMLYNAS